MRDLYDTDVRALDRLPETIDGLRALPLPTTSTTTLEELLGHPSQPM